ncbi:MAG: NAD-dependent epimerase/dehydratase family protein [Candidatus Izemoplasmatales bacterium]|nr:NAD-dependent epimerase/dehydratase family protein [Candidatus Izemoplasmatales bacterium]
MIYITGATGHIGNNLVKLMAKKNLDFKIIGRSVSKAIKDYKDRVIIGDIFNIDFLMETISENDTLIHLAAYINLKNDKKELTDEINFLGTKRIVDFCIEKNIYLIFASSTDAILNHDYLIKEPESIDVNLLNSYYQKSKAKATNYILEAIKNSKLKAVVIYPSAVIGINDFKPSAIGKEIMRASKRRVCFYFEGGYNFVDVLDVCETIIRSLEKQSVGSYIVSGEYIKLKTMYQSIYNELNRKVIYLKIPLFMIKSVSKIAPKLRVMISALLSKHNYDNSKIINELNIVPNPIDCTIKDTLTWFMEENK